MKSYQILVEEKIKHHFIKHRLSLKSQLLNHSLRLKVRGQDKIKVYLYLRSKNTPILNLTL